MPRKLMPVDTILDLLRQTPSRIEEMTAGLTAAQLRTGPAPGEWSANEVLAHVRACADVRGGCALTILAEDGATIRAVDPRRYLTETDYLEQDFGRSLRAFTAQRRELVAALEPLDSAGWSRRATVTGAGKPLVRTVWFYADWVARHERPHVKQIRRVVDALRR